MKKECIKCYSGLTAYNHFAKLARRQQQTDFGMKFKLVVVLSSTAALVTKQLS